MKFGAKFVTVKNGEISQESVY